MNFNTLTPSAKVLKKLHNYASGQPVGTKETPHIGVLVGATEVGGLVANIMAGIKSAGGVAFA